MAKCPKCEAKITNLVLWDIYEARGEAYLDSKGDLDSHVDTEPEYHSTDYECPECNEVIAKTQTEAIKILKGDLNGR